jgi:predicted amidohydrolase
MKVAILQVATELGNPKANRSKLEAAIEKAKIFQAEVIVFPETWNVGFIPNNITELSGNESESLDLQWMILMAKQYQVHLVGGSIAVYDEQKKGLHNRSYVIQRSGHIVAHYDKIHLFSPGKEADFFQQGARIVTFELEGIRCGVQICYDIRFPELSRAMALKGVQVMFTPAQWPHPRSQHWMTLNQARAIENQMFVVAANGCGRAGKVISCGHSLICDPWGEIMTQAKEEETILVSKLEITQVAEVRGKIPVFSDRRAELYS